MQGVPGRAAGPVQALEHPPLAAVLGDLPGGAGDVADQLLGGQTGVGHLCGGDASAGDRLRARGRGGAAELDLRALALGPGEAELLLAVSGDRLDLQVDDAVGLCLRDDLEVLRRGDEGTALDLHLESRDIGVGLAGSQRSVLESLLAVGDLEAAAQPVLSAKMPADRLPDGQLRNPYPPRDVRGVDGAPPAREDHPCLAVVLDGPLLHGLDIGALGDLAGLAELPRAVVEHLIAPHRHEADRGGRLRRVAQQCRLGGADVCSVIGAERRLVVADHHAEQLLIARIGPAVAQGGAAVDGAHLDVRHGVDVLARVVIFGEGPGGLCGDRLR